jgi:glutamine synthetase
VRTEITQVLRSLGVPVYYHHHEVGGPGQVEIEIPLADLLLSADYAMTIKYVVKQVARLNDLTATFMPKPLHSEAGSGMHCHQVLWKGDRNLFFDEKGYAGLSDLALHYIGGILTHGPALLGLTNPSTNSYRRLVPGFEAPTKAFFSQANRSAAIRVPKYATDHDHKRIEFRSPDGTANIYLMETAQLMAGLDGIRKRIDPRAHNMGPIDENVFSWSAEKQATILSLPDSLESALDALERDHDFLTEGGVFTEPFLKAWIEDHRHNDVAEIIGRPHPWEIETYFDV